MYSSEVYIKASSKGQPFTIREVKASYIGQLVRISGIVTRCSDVKPLMQVAVYTCEECGFEIYQVSKETPISDILTLLRKIRRFFMTTFCNDVNSVFSYFPHTDIMLDPLIAKKS